MGKEETSMQQFQRVEVRSRRIKCVKRRNGGEGKEKEVCLLCNSQEALDRNRTWLRSPFIFHEAVCVCQKVGMSVFQLLEPQDGDEPGESLRK